MKKGRQGEVEESAKGRRNGTRERGQPEGNGILRAKKAEWFKREVVRCRLRVGHCAKHS